MTTALLAEPQSGFASLELSPPILAALERANYVQPTPIQAALIPEALSGRDVIGQAQTGTGKTAAFVLPFLNSWTEEDAAGPRALVLVPTRELVAQVAEEAKKLTPYRDCRTVAIYGGQGMRGQLSDLRKGASIVVGTPGRLLDHLGRGTLSLDRIRYVVLDEADRMLDIGFRPDIERILRRCPQRRQTMLLSATVPPPVMRLTHRYMVDPIHISITPERPAVESIHQTFFTVDEEKKFDLLLRVVKREKPRQCIIFCERKRWADRLYRQLRKFSKYVATMHGDLEQPMREKIMKAFREGRIICLVATDVVGRGIDVMGISHIINYDLPEDAEAYVHRIGRTGRMGKDGRAIAFVTPEQGGRLTDIECFINKQIEEDSIEGFQGCTPREVRKEQEKPGEPETPKPSVPVFGRRVKRYSNRV
ncbi:MAG TPA: DEAD/DEAH box helicase [Gemmataceae bacterium]|nr:DEAD/DEAH box helicase [Gemmataceae bacterium]